MAEIEVTDAMLQAGGTACSFTLSANYLESIYRAMMAAAPKREERDGGSFERLAMQIAKFTIGYKDEPAVYEHLKNLLLAFAAEIERRAREAR